MKEHPLPSSQWSEQSRQPDRPAKPEPSSDVTWMALQSRSDVCARLIGKIHEHADVMRARRLESPDPIDREQDVILPHEIPDWCHDYLPGGTLFDEAFPIIAPLYFGEPLRKAWIVKRFESGEGFYLEATDEALMLAERRDEVATRSLVDPFEPHLGDGVASAQRDRGG